MKIGDKDFKQLFMAKERLDCANCGSKNFNLTKTPMAKIEEAVFMICKNCGHSRLELV